MNITSWLDSNYKSLLNELKALEVSEDSVLKFDKAIRSINESIDLVYKSKSRLSYELRDLLSDLNYFLGLLYDYPEYSKVENLSHIINPLSKIIDIISIGINRGDKKSINIAKVASKSAEKLIRLSSVADGQRLGLMAEKLSDYLDNLDKESYNIKYIENLYSILVRLQKIYPIFGLSTLDLVNRILSSKNTDIIRLVTYLDSLDAQDASYDKLLNKIDEDVAKTVDTKVADLVESIKNRDSIDEEDLSILIGLSTLIRKAVKGYKNNKERLQRQLSYIYDIKGSLNSESKSNLKNLCRIAIDLDIEEDDLIGLDEKVRYLLGIDYNDLHLIISSINNMEKRYKSYKIYGYKPELEKLGLLISSTFKGIVEERYNKADSLKVINIINNFAEFLIKYYRSDTKSFEAIIEALALSLDYNKLIDKKDIIRLEDISTNLNKLDLLGSRSLDIILYLIKYKDMDLLYKIRSIRLSDSLIKDIIKRFDSYYGSERLGKRRIIELVDALHYAELLQALSEDPNSIIGSIRSPKELIYKVNELLREYGVSYESVDKLLPFIRSLDKDSIGRFMERLKNRYSSSIPREVYTVDADPEIVKRELSIINKEIIDIAEIVGYLDIDKEKLNSLSFDYTKKLLDRMIFYVKKNDLYNKIAYNKLQNISSRLGQLERISRLTITINDDIGEQVASLVSVKTCLSPNGELFDYTKTYIDNLDSVVFITIKDKENKIVGRTFILVGEDPLTGIERLIARASGIHPTYLEDYIADQLDKILEIYAIKNGMRFIKKGWISVKGLSMLYGDLVRFSHNYNKDYLMVYISKDLKGFDIRDKQ
ncbi:MAG: hypothetical protein ARM1_0604 [Candidatus Micrarchaeota archaeon]|nr:MAG: hypothetical protein ARM1_0604 [Candidatus Micrarchaeota archaeon]